MSVIRCDVVAKNKVLFSGELYNVMVPGTEGELGIMENHEPFVSALKDGVIWARTQQEGGEVLSAAIMGGYVQVLKDRVIVICDKTRQIEPSTSTGLTRIFLCLKRRSLTSARRASFLALF